MTIAASTFAFILLSASAAQTANKDFFPDTPIAGWTVYGWENDCWMYKNYEDGTKLNFSLEDDGEFYLSAKNPNWRSIQQDRRYPISVRIGDLSSVEIATGHNKAGHDPNFVFFFSDPARVYTAFQNSPAISLSRAGVQIGTFSLSGSAAAAEMVEYCLTKRPGESQDPFAARARDPFSS